MAWIIQRTDQGGGYVAPPGRPSSYVRRPDDAQTYPTREAAERQCCPENERPVEYFAGHFGRH